MDRKLNGAGFNKRRVGRCWTKWEMKRCQREKKGGGGEQKGQGEKKRKCKN